MSAAPLLDAALALAAAWLAIGAAGLAALRRTRLVARCCFRSAARRAGAVRRGAAAVLGTPEVAVLPIGLPGLPFHLRLDASPRFFLMVIGAASAGVSAFAAGYFRKGEGTPPGLLCLRVPRLPRQHGAGRAGRRRLRVHGDVGDDGAVVVLPRHRQPPHRRDPPRRLPVPADRAHRRDRASCCASACCRPTPATTRFANMRAQHAVAVLGLGRLPARAVRLRRQGRHPAAARLAARGAPGGAVAGVGADERRDAEDRDLRPAARVVRPAAPRSSGGGACCCWRSAWPPRCSAWSSPRCRST